MSPPPARSEVRLTSDAPQEADPPDQACQAFERKCRGWVGGGIVWRRASDWQLFLLAGDRVKPFNPVTIQQTGWVGDNAHRGSPSRPPPQQQVACMGAQPQVSCSDMHFHKARLYPKVLY